ncbi:MAG: DUF1697 domain-containing protein [Nocardioides sp.]|uniref:DUF1697 domain-containing protein n=1 Tax=Nocardioides sp. TaxID=35761 RepID=UPI0039E499AA
MPTYVAFLRAINLGPTRKFPKEAIKEAVESVGATDVATYINTGNVRLTSRMRSVEKVAATLEDAFAADRGFEVPTIVFTVDELRQVVADADEFAGQFDGFAAHSVTLYSQPPPEAAARALEALALGDHALVRGRAAHVLVTNSILDSKTLTGKEFKALGVGTARYAKVLREIVTRWC